jgi:nuclear transport factor 2 (NTF2) superfamily protein
MNNPEKPRLPLPPFDYESAIQKVRITDEIEGITSDTKAAYSIARQVLTVI